VAVSRPPRRARGGGGLHRRHGVVNQVVILVVDISVFLFASMEFLGCFTKNFRYFTVLPYVILVVDIVIFE
jgi:hypothetical protein